MEQLTKIRIFVSNFVNLLHRELEWPIAIPFEGHIGMFCSKYTGSEGESESPTRQRVHSGREESPSLQRTDSFLQLSKNTNFLGVKTWQCSAIYSCSQSVSWTLEL